MWSISSFDAFPSTAKCTSLKDEEVPAATFVRNRANVPAYTVFTGPSGIVLLSKLASKREA